MYQNLYVLKFQRQYHALTFFLYFVWKIQHYFTVRNGESTDLVLAVIQAEGLVYLLLIGMIFIFFDVDFLGFNFLPSSLGYGMIFIGYKNLMKLSVKFKYVKIFAIIGFFFSMREFLPLEIEALTFWSRIYLATIAAVSLFMTFTLVYHLIKGMEDIAEKYGRSIFIEKGEKILGRFYNIGILRLLGMLILIFLNLGALINMILIVFYIIIKIMVLVYIWNIHKIVKS